MKIMPLFLDSEDVKIERKQIIRSHDIFQNEVRNNYTDVYMNTLYGLLFQNEKKYYVKIFDGGLGYLNIDISTGNMTTDGVYETGTVKTEFTDKEIEQL